MRVLLAGAAGGIGRETVHRLTGRGHGVVALDRDADGLAVLPDEVRTHAVDVADAEAVERVVTAVEPDAVVSAVGGYELGAVEDQPPAAFDAQLLTNLGGVHAVVRPALSGLRARGGRVVLVGSLLGRVALPYHGPYAAAKAGLAAYADTLRRELGPRGVGVSLVEPGPVATGLNERAAAGLRERLGGRAEPSGPASPYAADYRRLLGRPAAASTTADRVAGAVVDAVESDAPRARYRVGRRARWLPRLGAVLPARLFDRIVRSGTTGLLSRLVDR